MKTKIPHTYEEAFLLLDKRLKKSERIEIAKHPVTFDLHFGLGLWIRNSWIYGHSDEYLCDEPEHKDMPIVVMSDMESSDLIERYIVYLRKKYNIQNTEGIINEMTVPLKAYKTRVDGLRFLLVENWCLCKWCQLFNPECENFAHWITELKACIDNLKFLDIKNGIDKRRTLTRMLVNDYDYNDANMIERIVRGKFVRENISDNIQKVRVCIEFADNINGLIDAISLDAIDSDEYIQNTSLVSTCLRT